MKFSFVLDLGWHRGDCKAYTLEACCHRGFWGTFSSVTGIMNLGLLAEKCLLVWGPVRLLC